MDLAEFLVKAKKATWASGQKPMGSHSHPEFECFSFSDATSGFVYVDTYYARDSRPFGGHEIVFRRGKPVWMMNYFGGINPGADIRAVNSFLRKALREVPENLPFRGPPSLEQGNKEYRNEIRGNLKRFNGREVILFNGKEVFALDYIGGRV